jgi:hypothetical protein
MEFSTIVRRRLRLGMPREKAREEGYVCSLGSARIHTQCLEHFSGWRQANGLPPGEQDNLRQINAYLEECAEIYSQSTLDQRRGALQLFFRHPLPRIKSQLETVLTTRSYSPASVARIVVRQTEKNALATLLSHKSGLRAHEHATIRRADEASASPSRSWDARRFVGMPTGEIYVVSGKGGLRREVWIPTPLANALEARRRPAPVRVVDRGIFYDSYYDLGYGHAFSQSFYAASMNALGYSTGGPWVAPFVRKGPHCDATAVGLRIRRGSVHRQPGGRSLSSGYHARLLSLAC